MNRQVIKDAAELMLGPYLDLQKWDVKLHFLIAYQLLTEMMSRHGWGVGGEYY